MSEFVTVTLTIPIALRAAANRCAAILDFDTGGHKTFDYAVEMSVDGSGPATHLMISAPLKPQYIAMLNDPVLAMAALTALAEQYGRTGPAQEDVEAFCGGVIVGPTELVRVVAESPTA